VIFPHIAVRTPILPKRDLNHRSRSAGYELDDQTLSPIDSVALTPMRHPKAVQKGQVLDPCWTLNDGIFQTPFNNNGLGEPSDLMVQAARWFGKPSAQSVKPGDITSGSSRTWQPEEDVAAIRQQAICTVERQRGRCWNGFPRKHLRLAVVLSVHPEGPASR
jgi:hypothetical protein